MTNSDKSINHIAVILDRVIFQRSSCDLNTQLLWCTTPEPNGGVAAAAAAANSRFPHQPCKPKVLCVTLLISWSPTLRLLTADQSPVTVTCYLRTGRVTRGGQWCNRGMPACVTNDYITVKESPNPPKGVVETLKITNKWLGCGARKKWQPRYIMHVV